jgi:hypothetical protein
MFRPSLAQVEAAKPTKFSGEIGHTSPPIEIAQVFTYHDFTAQIGQDFGLARVSKRGSFSEKNLAFSELNGGEVQSSISFDERSVE